MIDSSTGPLADKVRSTPLPSWPAFDARHRNAVDAVLASGKVNQWTGTEVRDFETEFAEFLGVRKAVAVMNGTVALELALKALGVGAGDEVIVTPRSFIASVSSVVLVGAKPVFADVDSDSGNLTAGTIASAITPSTKALVLVHLAGWPCEMKDIMSLASEKDLLVIEDCAQAHGAEYDGLKVGSFGHASCFSFCQDKIITTGGEGGLLVTNDDEIWSRAWSYRDHGKSYEAVFRREHPAGFRWLHEEFGTNWRMTEMQAAIGRVALRDLPDWLTTRKRNADMLRATLLKYEGFRVPTLSEPHRHAYYKYYWYARPEALRKDWGRDRIMVELTRLGIPCYSGSCSEIYREKAFLGMSTRPNEALPVAMELGATSLMLPVHPTLSEQDVGDMCHAIDVVMRQAQA